VALVALSGPATSQETVLAIEFSFSNPGARSMGFGGAFAALADDATAAFANPAGLAQLARPEVSVEGRAWDYSTPFSEGGRLFGTPTGIGIDTTDGVRTARSDRQRSRVSFLSYVYPKERWAIALYRHLPASFEFYGETSGFLRSFPDGPPGANERFADQRSSVDFEIVSHGVAGAYRVTETLTVGAGLSHAAGRLVSEAELFKAVSFFDPPAFDPQNLELETVLSFDSSDWVLSAGLLWRLSEQWRLGGFYRKAPKFDLEATVRSGPSGPAPAGTQVAAVRSPVSMPDVYGLGSAFQSLNGRFTLGLEWDRVEYASIVESIDEESWGEVTSAIDNGSEWHLGGEWVLPRLDPVIALRCGVWLDPDHSLRAAEDTSILVKALRPPHDDVVHYAAGIGFAFEGIQLDLGVDVSDRRNTASISAIYSF
jgi:long-subunit fatty acid transport protein